MKYSRLRGGTSHEVRGINISPLIDMVFILLIYFIVDAFFYVDHGVKFLRPEAFTSRDLEKNSILLAITADEEVYYGGDSIGIDGVRPLIRRLLRVRQMPVILQVDQAADGEALVRVIEEARIAGGAVSVATQG
ncbi:MAG: biopolymer transporter ExbD [Opitutae bacterium]